jgi:predicted nucleotidyltransferase
VSEDLERAIRVAAEVLKAEGAREVYLFGSLAKGRERPESDIDLAVSGLPERKFFHAMACAHRAIGRPLDLIDLDENTPFVQFLREHGGLQLVG